MEIKRKPENWFNNLLLVDLIIGLYTSGKHLLRKKATVEYPDKRIEPTDRFRGLFKFIPDTCIACELCAKVCPIDIIYIEWHPEKTPEGKRKKVLDRYDIDVKRCMFCGLCEDVCCTKPKSISLATKSYEGATYEREKELYFDMERLNTYTGIPDPVIEEKPKPFPKPAPKPVTESSEAKPASPESEKPAAEEKQNTPAEEKNNDE